MAGPGGKAGGRRGLPAHSLVNFSRSTATGAGVRPGEIGLAIHYFRNAPRLRRASLFVLGGGSAAVLNLLLVYAGVEALGFDSSLQQNYVNVVTMEVSLVYSFLVYKVLVWRDETPYASRAFLQQLSLYHLSAGSGVLARVILFPLLQVAGVHYLSNVALGIVAGAAINYVLSDRYVFTDPGEGRPDGQESA